MDISLLNSIHKAKGTGTQMLCNLPKKNRRQNGSSIAELPVAIFGLFFIILFPLLDLGTIALRSATVYEAARNAAHHAGRAKTFLSNGEDGELSSKSSAVAWALATAKNALAGTEIKKEDVKLSIIGTPFDDKKYTTVTSTAPLNETQPENYVYQIEVQVTGKVEPLVKLNNELMGDIPGLTSPLKVSATFREFCEHPAGLCM